MRVTEIWRYPVKSLGGERVRATEIGVDGVEGDRQWGVLDPSTGLVLTARREPALLFLRATHVPGGRPIITCDDGGDLPDDAGLSAWIGRPVQLVPASAGPGTFENPMNVDDESDWVQWQSAGRTFHDGRSTVSLASRSSFGAWDARRFRVNLIVDGGGEDDMTGDVHVGSATLTIRKPIARCIMVTRAQPGIPKDRAVLERVIAERGNLLGVGAVVSTPGHVVVGDELISA